MRLIRALVFPWFLYFVVIVAGFVGSELKFPKLKTAPPEAYIAAVLVGFLACVILNFNTLRKVGIWMSESLPEAIRYGSWPWLFRAVKAICVAAVFYFIGQLPWTPLVWQGAVIPFVFMICIFVIVWSLYGPILKWSSGLAWNCAFSVFLSLPVVALVPLTALFLGKGMVSAYRASHGDIKLAAVDHSRTPTDLSSKADKDEATADSDDKENAKAKEADFELIDSQAIKNLLHSSSSESKAQAFQQLTKKPQECAAYSKEIQMALEPRGNKNMVYWATKCVRCAELRSPLALPKLVQIMMEHPDPKTRASAIEAMKKFGPANVRLISYLLVKRLGPEEPADVVEAAADTMGFLGGDDAKHATSRLKALLDVTRLSQTAAQTLITRYKRSDLVKEYVAENLDQTGEARGRAVAMLCLLPEADRTIAESHLSSILATIKSGEKSEPGVQALGCIGKFGFEAIRTELEQPNVLPRPAAARVLAHMDLKGNPEAIALTNSCLRDSDATVRKWCSQSLGKIGAPALPSILEILNSSDSHLKEAGRNALNNLQDPEAKHSLREVVVANSGWMANNKKLQLANTVGLALSRIEQEEQTQGSNSNSDEDSKTTTSSPANAGSKSGTSSTIKE